MKSRNFDNLNPFLPNRFTFVIEGIEEVTFNLINGSVPGMSVPAVPSPFRDRQGQVSGDRIQTDSISLTFLLDEALVTYRAAYTWLLNSVSSDVQRDVTIVLHTAQNTPNLSVRLINAIPTTLSPIDFNMQDENNEPIQVTLTVECDRIELV